MKKLNKLLAITFLLIFCSENVFAKEKVVPPKIDSIEHRNEDNQKINSHEDDILEYTQDLRNWGDTLYGISLASVFMVDTPTFYPFSAVVFFNKYNPGIFSAEFGVGLISKRGLSLNTGLNFFINSRVPIFHGKLLCGLGPYWQGLGFDGVELIEHSYGGKLTILGYNIWKKFSINCFYVIGWHKRKAVLHYQTKADQTKWLDMGEAEGGGIGLIFGF